MTTHDFLQPKTLAYKLRRIRENFRLTHEEMAEELTERLPKGSGGRVDAKMIMQVEAGEIVPPTLLLLAYSWYSDIPLESLIDDQIQPFT